MRAYKRKTLPPSYSKEDLNKDVEKAKSGWMIVYKVAKLHKIPKDT